MNVDIDNFHQARKLIRSHDLVKKSHFISLDLQFTGVRFDNNERDKYDMFLNDKYQKMSSVASKFNIVQVGVTFVVPNQKKNEKQDLKAETRDQKQMNLTQLKQNIHQDSQFIAYPFNFYVFPRETPSSNPTISMQAGCVQFNTTHQMDWNRWIKKGITFVRISQFSKHLQSISNSSINSTVTITNNSQFSLNNAFNGKNYNSVLQQLSEKIKTIVQGIVNNLKGKQQGYKYSVEVPRYGAGAIRRAIQCYGNQYQLNLMITKVANVQNQIETEQQELFQQKHVSPPQTVQEIVTLQIQFISEDRKLDQIQKQKEQILGFSLIFEEIWNSKKIIVGHNCLYDILFLYSSFVDELPRDYNNFKKLVCQNDDGRRFYDTKFIANRVFMNDMNKKGTSLEEIYKIFNQKNAQKGKKQIISLAPEFDSYDLNNPNLHEAGFDSYLTSWVFLNLPVEQEDEDKICIFKSYFYMNLKTQGDKIRNDLKIFVIAVVLNNAYVQYEQLKNMRTAQSKLIRDELQKHKLMNEVIVIDGFKQIFLSTKDINKTNILVQFLINLRKNKLIKKPNVMSLQMWVKMRAEVQALVTASNQNKSKASEKQ